MLRVVWKSSLAFLTALLLTCAGLSLMSPARPVAASSYSVGGGIGEKWWSAGGPNGSLGQPVSPEFDGLRDGGASQMFQGGTIFWSWPTGSHIVRGGLLGKFQSLGFESGTLGYPLGDEIDGLRNGGAVQMFQAGKLYWTPTGAHLVRGAIDSKWSSTGWENGSLGYPITDEFSNLRDGGASQVFQSGGVYWSWSTAAHMVRGAILADYERDNFEEGPDGYPTGDEYQRGADAYQGFQGVLKHWYGQWGQYADVLNDSYYDYYFSHL